MKILTDLHTHTDVSVHAYSTLYENMLAAKQKGLEMVACTDHTPALEDAPHIWHFTCLKDLPRTIEGVKLVRGAETNILDGEGHVDLPDDVMEKLDLVIASIHGPVYMKGCGVDHTKTWLGVIENPYIDILGHSGSPSYAYDIETIVRAAKDADKCIEINNHSFEVRQDNIERCREIALACKRIGTKITVDSDAHFMSNVGKVNFAVKMLEDIDFPEELVMNLNAERVTEYIFKRRGIRIEF